MNVQRTAFAGLVSYGVLRFTFWFTFRKRSRDEYLGLRGMHRFSIATGGGDAIMRWVTLFWCMMKPTPEHTGGWER